MERYKRKPRRARIQMAITGEKKRSWMDFAKGKNMNLTELIEVSVDALVSGKLAPDMKDYIKRSDVERASRVIKRVLGAVLIEEQ